MKLVAFSLSMLSAACGQVLILDPAEDGGGAFSGDGAALFGEDGGILPTTFDGGHANISTDIDLLASAAVFDAGRFLVVGRRSAGRVSVAWCVGAPCKSFDLPFNADPGSWPSAAIDTMTHRLFVVASHDGVISFASCRADAMDAAACLVTTLRASGGRDPSVAFGAGRIAVAYTSLDDSEQLRVLECAATGAGCTDHPPWVAIPKSGLAPDAAYDAQGNLFIAHMQDDTSEGLASVVDRCPKTFVECTSQRIDGNFGPFIANTEPVVVDPDAYVFATRRTVLGLITLYRWTPAWGTSGAASSGLPGAWKRPRAAKDGAGSVLTAAGPMTVGLARCGASGDCLVEGLGSGGYLSAAVAIGSGFVWIAATGPNGRLVVFGRPR